jgi:hypothetical protein
MSVSGTPGTGTITLGSAVSGYQTFAAAGVVNGEVVSYSILDGTNWEVGRGTYTASGATLTRGPLFSNNNNAAINVSSSAVVWIAPLAEDFKISALQDTSVSNATDGQVLEYVAAAGKWENLSLPNVAPQGRLTLTSGTPVLSSDVAAATTVYYTPYRGNAAPVPVSAGVFKSMAFTELSLALDGITSDSGYQASGSLYDIFLYNNSGTLVFGTGPAWSSATSRGTGAGTTQIQMVGGLWVNANSLTLRLGTGSANTVSVAAQMALYLGTMYATANGQTTVQLHPAAAGGGSSPVLGLWNAYNRAPAQVWCNDSNGSWTYNVNATWRNADNSANFRVTWVDGLKQSPVLLNYYVTVQTGASGGDAAQTGVGLDGSNPTKWASTKIGNTVGYLAQAAIITNPPLLGLHYGQAMEYAAISVGPVTFYGNANSSLFFEGEF